MDREPIREFRKSVEGAINTIQKVIKSGNLYEDAAVVFIKKNSLGVTFIEGAPDVIEDIFESACKRDPSFLEIIRNVASKDFSSNKEDDKSHDAKIDIYNMSDKDLNNFIDNLIKKINRKDDDGW